MDTRRIAMWIGCMLVGVGCDPGDGLGLAKADAFDEQPTGTYEPVDDGASESTGPAPPKLDVSAEDPELLEEMCLSRYDEDLDGDGFAVSDGDCNDCDANINPAAIEVIRSEPDETGEVPEPTDEDCDGIVDNPPMPCDDDLEYDSRDPMDAARAMEICNSITTSREHWGVIRAEYVRADGTRGPVGSHQRGLLDRFGNNVDPHRGNRLLVLSSGRARTPEYEDACGAHSCEEMGCGTSPPGFPQSSPSCDASSSGALPSGWSCGGGSSLINDDIALELTLRAPSNATGYQFDFNFFSFEYPEWVCDRYNDQFVALVDPPPQGAVDGNISFDTMRNPVSVNIAFFEVCEGCALGTDELAGTGFDQWDDAGGTSWLRTTAPVQGGQMFTIRFGIWDAFDAGWDSTVLIDNFSWIANAGTVPLGTHHEG